MLVLLVALLPLAAAGISYSSYWNLWGKWKSVCNKKYSTPAQDTNKFYIFRNNCKKAGLPPSGTLSNWSKLPCWGADQTYYQAARQIGDLYSINMEPTAEELEGFWWLFKLQKNLKYRTRAQDNKAFLEFRKNIFKFLPNIPIKDPEQNIGGPVFLTLRLVGGKTPSLGRLEIRRRNGRWGTICRRGFGAVDASVACRQLGEGMNGTVLRSGAFGPGSGAIWLSQVACTGNETRLEDCRSRGWGHAPKCSHAMDVAIRCRS